MDLKTKSFVVKLILDGKVEESLELVAHEYDVSVPAIEVGLPKGRKRNVLGCYSPRERTIRVLNSDILREPFVVLHEFYHHLRTNVDHKHMGTEKNANQFAREFIEGYRAFACYTTQNDASLKK